MNMVGSIVSFFNVLAYLFLKIERLVSIASCLCNGSLNYFVSRKFF